jgi:hypothetical protein
VQHSDKSTDVSTLYIQEILFILIKVKKFNKSYKIGTVSSQGMLGRPPLVAQVDKKLLGVREEHRRCR